MSEPCTCPPHAEPGDAWICPAHGHRYILVPYYEVRYVDRHGKPMPPPEAPEAWLPDRPDPQEVAERRQWRSPDRPKPPPEAPGHGKPEGTPNPWWRRLLRRIRT